MRTTVVSSRGRRSRTVAALAVGAVAALLVGACSESSSTGRSNGGEATASTGAVDVGTPVDYSKPGPYPVGTLSLLLEPNRCTPIVDGRFGCPQSAVVYYPADASSAAGARRITGYSSSVAFPETLRALVPPEYIQDVMFSIDVFDGPKANAEGPFPVVLHSHDMGGFDLFESRYLAHLASWGFVVAAPDHLARLLAGQLTKNPYEGDSADIDDLRRTLSALRSTNVAGSSLHGAIDPAHVVASGHGVGASVAIKLAADPDITTYIAKAPTGVPDRIDGGKVGLVAGGDASGHVSLDDLRLTFSKLGPKARLVVMRNVGHNTFTDLCGPMHARGGLSQYAEKLPTIAELLRTSEDGCTPERIDPKLAEGLTNHLAVAHLRWALGMDPSPVSLAGGFLATQFPEVFASDA